MINRYATPFRRRLLASAATLLLMSATPVCPVHAADAAPEDDSAILTASAKHWLAEWDLGHFAVCWSEFGPEAQGRMSKEQWIAQTTAAHERLGSVTGRTLIGVVGPHTKDGKPAAGGDVVRVSYAASFENAPEMIESIAFKRKPDGQWSLLGHLVALKQPPDDPDAGGTFDKAERTRVIQAIIRNLRDYYVDPEGAEKMAAAISDNAGKGAYDEIDDAPEFTKALTDDLRGAGHDLHVRVFYSPESRPNPENQPPDPKRQEMALKQAQQMNFGFQQVGHLPGNIGYIDLRGFMAMPEAREVGVRAMNALAGARAFIFDLRRNGGGSPIMIDLLASYFFDGVVHLNDFYERKGAKTKQFFTSATVEGQRFGPDKPVFVVTSRRTFSGAEEFAYDLKVLKRATIVGETTGGGANPGGVRWLDPHFAIFVPTGRAVNPITKTNWEGVGVSPDIRADSGTALKVAYLEALDRLIGSSGSDADRAELERIRQTTQQSTPEAIADSVIPVPAGPKPPAPSGFAQPPEVPLPPATPAGRQFSAWLDAFNSGDRTILGEFLQTNWPSTPLESHLDFRKRTGGYELRALEQATATTLTGLMQERDSDQFVRFTIAVEPTEPHRITQFQFRGIPRPAGYPMPRMAGEQKYAALQVPTLAIFAVPHSPPPGFKGDVGARTKFAESDVARTGAQADAFERQVPAANEADVLREMNTFIGGLP